MQRQIQKSQLRLGRQRQRLLPDNSAAARSAAIEMVNIPYLGSAPSLQALVAGPVDL